MTDHDILREICAEVRSRAERIERLAEESEDHDTKQRRITAAHELRVAAYGITDLIFSERTRR